MTDPTTCTHCDAQITRAAAWRDSASGMHYCSAACICAMQTGRSRSQFT